MTRASSITARTVALSMSTLAARGCTPSATEALRIGTDHVPDGPHAMCDGTRPAKSIEQMAAEEGERQRARLVAGCDTRAMLRMINSGEPCGWSEAQLRMMAPTPVSGALEAENVGGSGIDRAIAGSACIE